MTFTIKNEDTGAEFHYASEAAYEAALDWYNRSSKREMLDWYAAQDFAARGGPVGAIWADADCRHLVADWHDIVMHAHYIAQP